MTPRHPDNAASDWSPIRASLRWCRLAGAIATAAVGLALLFARARGRPSRAARAAWLHRSCRRLLPVFGLQLTLRGVAPRSGLLVSNHLGYLDVLVLAATTPCVFVAKAEVRHWPVFGWFARAVGTVFVTRSRRLETGAAVTGIAAALADGLPVVLFAEGTSSGGAAVLPFRSALLDAAVRHGHPATPVALDYILPGGDAAAEVCYWKDMTLVPHLANLLGHRRIEARLTFRPVLPAIGDRKRLAASLHAEVLRAREPVLMPCPA